MIIESTMTKKDFTRLNIALIFDRMSTRICLAVLFLLVIVALFNLYLAKDYLLIIVWLGIVIFLVGYYWTKMSRYVNSKENVKFYLQRRFEFKDSGVLITTSFAKEEANWGSFVKWRFIAGQYVIYASSNNFYAINADDVKDKQGFENMLQEKVKKP